MDRMMAIVAGLIIFIRRLMTDMVFSRSTGVVRLTPSVHSRSWSMTVNKAM